MMLRFATLMIVLPVLLLLGACGDDKATTTTTTTSSNEAAAAAQPAGTISGTVVETMDAASYTYVMVEVDGKQVWAAGPQTTVAVGDAVSIATDMPMPGFRSEALDRTFETLYFVNTFGGDAPAKGSGMGGMGGTGSAHPAPEPAADIDLSGIARAEGGQTVAEVYAAAEQLEGQKVRVQGKVVTYNVGIMDRNWVHVRDGSGAEGANDLTVTTQNFAKVGDLVVIEGTLARDRDFGHGYRYDVIVEEAAVEKVRK